MGTVRTLLDLEEAQARILSLALSLPLEEVEMEQAIGRALGVDQRALRTLPPWDNSAMDGYAVRSEDVREVPVQLEVVDRIMAGQRPVRAIRGGECARIMTGAPLPPGADAVVMQERTRTPSESRVDILEAARPGQFVRPAGEDAREGQLLLGAGTSLGIPEASLLWAQGLERVRVPRRPRVAILSNGDELCTPGEAAEDRIVDSNGPALAAAVRRGGGEPRYLGIARDSVDSLTTLLDTLGEADVLLTSAGVSVGERDFVKEALESRGVQLDFWKVAIKPGKPLVVGRKDSLIVLGLPGNPASSLVGFELFVRPLLRKMLGFSDSEALPQPVEGRLGTGTLEKAAGLTHLVRVRCTFENGHLQAYPLSSQTSGALRSAASATHLLVFPKGATRLSPGEPVALLPLSWTAR